MELGEQKVCSVKNQKKSPKTIIKKQQHTNPWNPPGDSARVILHLHNFKSNGSFLFPETFSMRGFT